MNILKESPLKDKIIITDAMAGLHFTVKLKTDKSDRQLKEEALKIKFLSDYSRHSAVSDASTLLINYTALETDTMEKAIAVLEKIL